VSATPVIEPNPSAGATRPRVQGAGVSELRTRIKAIAELFKPITWFPPMWAFACGAIAGGLVLPRDWILFVVGLILCGPMVCATSQAVNDWFDRHVDAINEPHRPIPSGRLPGRLGLQIAIVWTAASVAVASLLGPWGFGAAALGLCLAWMYSAPPFRLKQNGWWGNLACGLSYEGLAWVTGAALVAGVTAPPAASLIIALLYSIGAHGIMTLNDFKSISGDQQMGIRSLPVQLGEKASARVACLMMLIPQLVVVSLLLIWGQYGYGLGVAGLVCVQAFLMVTFMRRPIEKATWYSAIGINFFVAGMMLSAFALRAMGAPS
jgi:chlorophyll synthase